MATLSSLQDRLQGLGTRLQAENEAQSRDRMNTNLNLEFTRERPGSERRPRPVQVLCMSVMHRCPWAPDVRPLAEVDLLTVSSAQLGGVAGHARLSLAALLTAKRPKIELPFAFEPRQQPDPPELDAHVKEITRKNGILTIESKKYKSSIEDMEYISELGNGTSGNVVKMLHKSSKKVIAVKQMRRSGNMEETKRVFFDLEVVLKSHDCPYIVQCLGCFITDSDVWICMELMATCLDKLTKRYKQPIPEPILGKISVATLKALHYLKESHGVIHRDVKPSNILLDERGNIKLCDFGISGRLVDSKAKTRSAGCAAYMAPDYDIRADVWSLGITLVELATGQFPYKDCRNDFEVLTKVLQDDPPSLPKDGTFSPEFCEFVNDCLIKEYRHRPKYKKLLDYPFIKKYEQKKVDVSAWFADLSINTVLILSNISALIPHKDLSINTVLILSNISALIPHKDLSINTVLILSNISALIPHKDLSINTVLILSNISALIPHKDLSINTVLILSNISALIPHKDLSINTVLILSDISALIPHKDLSINTVLILSNISALIPHKDLSINTVLILSEISA
ncbi:Dual specificity mitogen-activated protein kinase kinase 7-like [Homarus americanus]|uniref:mitogen-activated protein kinase kinase n=1 Tax=Homarus americanus TaxID=6706 RepID=A0A8J5TEP4_HOMAM|nr:Dual specificity mitogen-activated protein kinase kinase 7-like [Homarus americanus]